MVPIFVPLIWEFFFDDYSFFPRQDRIIHNINYRVSEYIQVLQTRFHNSTDEICCHIASLIHSSTLHVNQCAANLDTFSNEDFFSGT